MVLGDAARPALFVFGRDQVQPFGHDIGHGLQVSVGLTRIEGPGQRRLFQNPARVVGWEGVQHPAERARAVDHAAQVGPGKFFARCGSRSTAPSSPMSIR